MDVGLSELQQLVMDKETWHAPWGSQNCKEIQPVHSEGDRPWDFFVRDDAKAEAPVLWPPHEQS